MDKILKKIFSDEFLVMIIPAEIKLPKNYELIDMTVSGDNIIDIIENEYIVTMRIKNVGTFIFSSRYDDLLFEKLQKKYRAYTNYVFGANETYGYFKILIDGKIARKIASYGVLKGNIRSYEQLRGKPCDYEIKKDCIYKFINENDRLERFTKEEVFKLFDYYIGFSCLESNSVEQIQIYNYLS